MRKRLRTVWNNIRDVVSIWGAGTVLFNEDRVFPRSSRHLN